MIPRLLTAAKHALMERVSDREAVPGMAGFLRRVARFNLYPSVQEKHTERKKSSSAAAYANSCAEQTFLWVPF